MVVRLKVGKTGIEPQMKVVIKLGPPSQVQKQAWHKFWRKLISETRQEKQ
jgi:hypothetical protein